MQVWRWIWLLLGLAMALVVNILASDGYMRAWCVLLLCYETRACCYESGSVNSSVSY